ncbi:hypothetical protein ACFQ5B_17425, partial [Laceyella putida]|uniref:hypothetical protein n=1 Tax=Laceyella putida TaxID=110101 RepID=UPI003637D700
LFFCRLVPYPDPNRSIRKLQHQKIKNSCSKHPLYGIPSNAVFHPTLETVGFQPAKICKLDIKRRRSRIHLLEKALSIATKAHSGQLDKGGKPYILHPLSVMMRVDSLEEKIVALLHDVIEDTEITISDLQQAGFYEKIIDAIQAVTRQNDETYEQFIERIAHNPLAIQVKLADLEENMDLSRISEPTPKHFQRLERYQSAYKRLQSAKTTNKSF